MKRLNLIMSMVTLVLVLFAVGCSPESSGSSKSPESSGSSQLERVEAQLAFDNGMALYSQRSLSLYEEPISHFTKAIQLDPDIAEEYYYRGESYFELDQYQNAIDDFDKAIQVDPDYADAYIGRADYYLMLDQNENAIEELSKAIELDPDKLTTANAYWQRGHIYYELGQHRNVIDDYTKALKIYPDSSIAHLFKASILDERSLAYEELGQDANADADKSKTCELDSRYC